MRRGSGEAGGIERGWVAGPGAQTQRHTQCTSKILKGKENAAAHLRDVHQISRQAEALHPRPADVGLAAGGRGGREDEAGLSIGAGRTGQPGQEGAARERPMAAPHSDLERAAAAASHQTTAPTAPPSHYRTPPPPPRTCSSTFALPCLFSEPPFTSYWHASRTCRACREEEPPGGGMARAGVSPGWGRVSGLRCCGVRPTLVPAVGQ